MKKLNLIVFSGSYEKIHYGLVTACAALSINRPTTFFFTMDAVLALTKIDSIPGWQKLPTECSKNKTAVDKDIEFSRMGLATFEELLQSCIELNANFMICEMGIVSNELNIANLRQDIKFKSGGLATFLKESQTDSTIIFI